MKKLVFLILPLIYSTSFSQYYYNDIVASDLSNKNYQILQSNRIKNIKASSYDAENQLSEGFLLEQSFTSDYKKQVTQSATASGSTSYLNALYENNQLKSTNEITKGIETNTEYIYNDKGKIQSITSTSTDTSLQLKSVERHLWYYDGNSRAVQMLKIKNNSDTTYIELLSDEHGNIIEEHWKRKNITFETYYYYYNDQNQLTDIVRFNKRVQKLLPDFLFEYDTAGRISKMIQVPPGSSNYNTWEYHYTNNGLKLEEICTNRQNQLLGKVVYSYR